jgi:putative ABC transport system permease protein
MRALDKKLIRDIRRLWAQTLAIGSVMACGIAILVMAFGAERSLHETSSAYYERNRFADVFASATRAPQGVIREIAEIEGVSRAEGRIATYALMDIEGMSDPGMAQVISLPGGRAPVLNIPLMREGRWPDSGRADEVLVNEAFALAHGFRPGDRFSLTLNGQKRAVQIAGTVLSPEFIYTIPPGGLMPDDRRFAVVWMPDAALEAALDLAGAYNSITLGLTRGTDPEPVIDALEILLKPYGGTGAYARKDQISNAFLEGELEQQRVMSRTLPPVFLIIAAFLVNMVLGRLIRLEREQIGLFKALGYGEGEVAWHYLKLSVLIAMFGVGAGWALGVWGAQWMAQTYAEFFYFPYLVFVQDPAVYVVSGLAGVAASMSGAATAVRRVVRLKAAVAMQPPAPTRFRRGLLDRVIRFLRPRQPTMMIMRSIGRWPLRAALTTLGIATSGAVLVASFFMFDAMDELLDVAFVQVNRQDAILTFAAPLPEAVLEDVGNMPGVMQAEGVLSAAARLHHGHLTRTIGIEGRREGDSLSRVFDADSGELVAPEHGIVLARRLAAHLGVRVGDVLEVEFLQISEERHRVVVTGVITQFFGIGAYMDIATLSALMGRAPLVSMANVLIDEALEEELYSMVKSAPVVAGVIFLAQIREAFDAYIGENASIMTTIFSMVAGLITVGVVYNSARIALSERARELASLRILGFSRGEVSYILLGEIAVLTVLAIPLGFAIGYGLAAGMVSAFESDLYAIPLVVTRDTYMRAALTVLIASVVSALIVRRRIDRMDLVAVMKTRE